MSQDSRDFKVEPQTDRRDLVVVDQTLPTNLFIVPIRYPVIFPGLIAPVIINEPEIMANVEEAINRNRMIGLLLTRDEELEEQEGASFENMYRIGVVAKVLKRLKLPDGSIHLLVTSIKRFKVEQAVSETPRLIAEVKYLEDIIEKDVEMDALNRMMMSQIKRLSETNPYFNEDMRFALINAPGPGAVADLVAFALSLHTDQGQALLEALDVKERLRMLLVQLKKEEDVANVQRSIQEDVNSQVNKNQREFYLREQLRAIKRELGADEDLKSKWVREFEEKIAKAKMPESVEKVAREELQRFETLFEQSPEFNVSRTYLETLLSVPWSERTEDHFEIDYAESILNEDHFGLERVKERVLEYLAVRALVAKRHGVKQGYQNKGSILCLVGPPGVGKTSIGRSVAKSLGREFYRFSLGGMRDEAEIRGHRRTYVGAMPGKIVQALRRVGKKNPVILLDEIDKLGSSYQGDPSNALLEVLDPEQNSTFVDHYLDVPVDLSEVLFIATANSLSGIPEPLLDRLEVIEIPGYTLEEKAEIASRYIWPTVLKESGLDVRSVKFSKKALKKVLEDYAREPGVRNLKKQLERIARKAAARILKGSVLEVVDPDHLKEWLGPKQYTVELAERITVPGVVVGLAWTAAGGDILFIEATKTVGVGKLQLTGQMGEVMTESASIAWTFVKKLLTEREGWKKEDLDRWDVHLHIPAGAIPKDGPSAGITMATALYSLMSGRLIRPKLAMTGELSLVGKVLPVGGIKEKVLAAKRAGIQTIVLPKQNGKDLEDLPAYAKKGMTFKLVDHLDEVLPLALTRAPAVSKTKKQK